jgi:hypothetical protein
MGTEGVGKRMNCLRRSGGTVVRVYAHLTEVVAESGLEKRPTVAIERLARRPQHVMRGLRNVSR